MSQNEAESEFGKRTVSFNHIVRQECKYSCWLGKAGERGKRPDRTQEFISIDVLDRARRKFPSCEVCPLDIDKSDHDNPPSNCYDARHQYPSKCPKDIWFQKLFGSAENK